MKRLSVTTVAALALATAACGTQGNADQDTAANPQDSVAASGTATTDPAAAGASADGAMAPASSGQTFADEAAASDMFEIRTSELAKSKAQSAKVKTFAEQMIKAHTDSTAKLKAATAKATPAITPAPRLNAMQQSTLDELSGKSGAEFDTAYAAAQVQAHQMTLDKLKSYSANGDVAPLKAFATELVPIVTEHLTMAKGL